MKSFDLSCSSRVFDMIDQNNLFEYTKIPPSAFYKTGIHFYMKTVADLLLSYELKLVGVKLDRYKLGDITYTTLVGRCNDEEVVILSLEPHHIRDENGDLYCFFTLDDAKKSLPIIKNCIELAIL